jgi:hypothetical protein
VGRLDEPPLDPGIEADVGGADAVHPEHEHRVVGARVHDQLPPATRPGRMRGSAARATVAGMCRNIRCLHNFEPATTDAEVREAALQFVRKVSGSTHPSRANTPAFEQAIDEIAVATRRMLDQLVTNAPPKTREAEAIKGRARHEKRMEREVRIRTAAV